MSTVQEEKSSAEVGASLEGVLRKVLGIDDQTTINLSKMQRDLTDGLDAVNQA